MCDEVKFREKFNAKNSLRYEIKQKKATLAKFVSKPDLLEETLILKSEIEALELELENL